MATAAKAVLTPANFYHFQRPKFNFQPLYFTFETFGKKFAEIEKSLLNCLRGSNNKFYQNLSITVKVGGFLAAAEALLKCFE